MAKVTKEQIKKWNEQLHGGFVFDWRHYIVWSEKLARHNIDLKNGKVLQITLEYYETRDGTERFMQPALHFQVWTPTDTGLMSSSGFGKRLNIGERQNKKSWSVLCKLSADYDDEKLFALAVEQLGDLERAEVA